MKRSNQYGLSKPRKGIKKSLVHSTPKKLLMFGFWATCFHNCGVIHSCLVSCIFWWCFIIEHEQSHVLLGMITLEVQPIAVCHLLPVDFLSFSLPLYQDPALIIYLLHSTQVLYLFLTEREGHPQDGLCLHLMKHLYSALLVLFV